MSRNKQMGIWMDSKVSGGVGGKREVKKGEMIWARKGGVRRVE